MVQKRPFHVYHGGEFGTSNQEPKRINMFQTAVGEDNLFACLEPLIRKVVREETEGAIAKFFPSSCSVSESETTEGYSVQLLFESKLPDQIFTNSQLKAECGRPLKIQLYDANSKTIVKYGPLSSAKVDIVVIHGLFSSDREDWTEEKFNAKILSEREGKRPLLAGPQSIVLKNGVGLISDLSITDNSSWIPNKKFILGARISQKNSGEQRVKPAISYPFSVKDSRGEGYTKHYPPSLHDEVWRLERIRKDGKFHEQLALHGIVTVKDFLLLNGTNQPELRRILDRMSDKTWRKVLGHAKTCIMDDCTVSRCPNGWNGALVEDLNKPIYLNRFDGQATPKLSLTYQQAGPSSISPNLGLQPLGPGIVLSQENLQIRAPNTYNSEEDGAQPSIFQIYNNPTDQAFPQTLQPDYTVEECTFLPQSPVYFTPAPTEHGNHLLLSSSYAAETGGCGIFPYLDHGADILNGAD
ncbi:calmodulin-binding protein 60 B-like isoform X2 [Benincasa hispida]|uniref:calmodulin-binding protein 60 B-like isoform X2 n=1 Tax=Benincasa hispida TaxID=102211 RepID=UPI0019003CA7|nr:calmodulin-binding protein 60 B-like isoform X2 [Benincasa hispida]